MIAYEKLPGPMGAPLHIIGNALPMREIFRVIQRVSRIYCPILIVGETGTGKHLVGRAIHEAGPLHDRAFLMLHCGLDREAIETEFSTFFLQAPSTGTCTGSQPSEGANTGTLFLHEITNLPLEVQARISCLLRRAEVALACGEAAAPLAPRIIAATSSDLSAAIAEGKFSRDLYFLLNVVSITLPPLRERKADIPLLAEQILRRISISQSRAQASNSPWVLSAEAAERLLGYDWPGNVRELENCLMQAVLLSSAPVIQLSDLPAFLQPGILGNAGSRRVQSLVEIERQAILEAVVAASGNKKMAAQMLGIGKTTLYRKLHDYENVG